MVVRTADEDSRLLHADLFYQLEVLLAGTDPACHLRKLIAALHTLIHRIPVLLAVKEELTGTDHALRTAELVQVVKDRDNLLRRIRRSRLLSVTERCIGDPDVFRHIVRHDSVVERNFRYFRIREHIAEYIWFFHIVQNVHMLFYFQKIVFLVHCDRAILEGIILSH